MEIAPSFGRLNVMPYAFVKDYENYLKHRGRQVPQEPAIAHKSPLEYAAVSEVLVNPTGFAPEHSLLLVCLHFERLGKPLAHELLPRDWIDVTHPAGRILRHFLSEFEHDAWPGRDHLDELLETPEDKALVAALLFEAPDIDDPRKVVNEGLRHLQARVLEPQVRQIELEIAAKQSDVHADLLPLLRGRSELQRQLRQPPMLAADV